MGWLLRGQGRQWHHTTCLCLVTALLCAGSLSVKPRVRSLLSQHPDEPLHDVGPKRRIAPSFIAGHDKLGPLLQHMHI